MSEHDAHTSCVNRCTCRKRADTFHGNSAQRSWGAVETVRREASGPIIGPKREQLTDSARCLDGNHRGNDADEVRVEAAAGVGGIARRSFLVAVMMDRAVIGMAVVIMSHRSTRNAARAAARR